MPIFRENALLFSKELGRSSILVDFTKLPAMCDFLGCVSEWVRVSRGSRGFTKF